MKNKSEIGEVDEISQLPDDVLVAIISRLTWREAVATSFLSTRWRHLYTYITRLSYIGRHPSEQSKDKYLKEKEPPEYMMGIYNFLASSKGCRFLEEFKVYIPCLKRATIKRWLPSVLKKEVESIDIHMIHPDDMPCCFTFPRETLIKRKGYDFPGLKSLRKLSLHSVDMCDREVELLVSSFTVLEHLSILGTCRLEKVSFVGHSKLKKLDVSSSSNVVSIEVHDMINLVSLTCYELSSRYKFFLSNVPKLVDFNSSDQFHLLGNVFRGISSSILDQLLQMSVHSAKFFEPPNDLVMNLKHLELRMKFINVRGGILLRMFPLFWQPPSMEKLEVEILWREAFDDPLIGYYKREYSVNHLQKVTIKWSPFELNLLFFEIRRKTESLMRGISDRTSS